MCGERDLKIEGFERRITQQTERIKRLREENEKLRRPEPTALDLQVELTSALTNENKKLSLKVLEYQSINSGLLAANEKLYDENETLARKVGQFRGSNERLGRENAELRKEIEILKQTGVRWQIHPIAAPPLEDPTWKSPLAKLKEENARLQEKATAWWKLLEGSVLKNAKLREALDTAIRTVFHLDGWLRNNNAACDACWAKDDKARIEKLEKALAENEKIDAAHAANREELVVLSNERINEKNERIKKLEWYLACYRGEGALRD